MDDDKSNAIGLTIISASGSDYGQSAVLIIADGKEGIVGLHLNGKEESMGGLVIRTGGNKESNVLHILTDTENEDAVPVSEGIWLIKLPLDDPESLQKLVRLEKSPADFMTFKDVAYWPDQQFDDEYEEGIWACVIATADDVFGGADWYYYCRCVVGNAIDRAKLRIENGTFSKDKDAFFHLRALTEQARGLGMDDFYEKGKLLMEKVSAI